MDIIVRGSGLGGPAADTADLPEAATPLRAAERARGELQTLTAALDGFLAGGPTAGTAARSLARLGPAGSPLAEALAGMTAERQGQALRDELDAALQGLTGGIARIAELPIARGSRQQLAGALLARAQELGLVSAEPELPAFLASHLALAEGKARIAGTQAEGEAAAVLAELEAEPDLQPGDRAQLAALAEGRGAVERQRHLGRLRGKEQDDLAAFRRGESVVPLSEESFERLYGPDEGPRRRRAYRAAEEEGRALAAIRGRDDEAIAAAAAAWDGDPAVFAAALAADRAARAADPLGYALETQPGLEQAMAEAETPAERAWIACAAQERQGTAPADCRLWAPDEARALADAWDALPSGAEGRDARLAFFEQHLLSLDPAQRKAAIGQLVAEGIADGTEAELAALVADLEAGRVNPARAKAQGLTPAGGARSSSPTELNGLRRDGPGTRSGEPSSVPLVEAQLITPPLPRFSPVPPSPGIESPSPGEALQQLWDRMTEPELPPIEPDEPSADKDTPEIRIEITDARSLYADPVARGAVDRLTLSGLTAKEAEAVVGEIHALQEAGRFPGDLQAFAEDYGRILPVGSADPAERAQASERVAEVFRAIQSVDGRMSLAELSLIERSPDYVAATGRNVAWLEDDVFVIGNGVEVGREWLVVETASGLVFAKRQGSGANARYLAEDLLGTDAILSLQSSKARKRKASGQSTEVTPAGSPNQDPDDDEKNKWKTLVYLAFDAAGYLVYVGITDWIDKRESHWRRTKGWRIEEIDGLGRVRRELGRGVEQVLIEYYRDAIDLANKINSIAKNNPLYARILKEALKVLEDIDFKYPLQGPLH